MEESPIAYLDYVKDKSKSSTISRLKTRLQRVSKNLRVQGTDDLGDSRVKKGISLEIPEITDAINKSIITISLIDEAYLDRVEKYPELKNKIIEIQNSKGRYYFPLIFNKTNWLRAEWLSKSKLYPSNGFFSNKTYKSQEEIFDDLFSQIEVISEILKGVNLTEKIEPKVEQESIASQTTKSSEQSKVFISHAGIDSDFAQLLLYELQNRGISAWLDKEKLKIGNNWQKEIDEGIENSKAVIVVLSPESQNSQYVTYEWSYASGLGKKIFPLMLRQTQIHPKLDILQYLDFTNFRTRNYEELANAIKNLKYRVGKGDSHP